MPLDPSVFVHSHALCESDDVGPRTRVWAFAHVMTGARVGADCNVCDHVFIEAGAVVGDRVTMKNNVLIWDGVMVESDVFLGPNVVFTNDLRPRAAAKKTRADFLATVVRTGASIGANSTIVCGIEVGEHAMVGAGSVVIRDVPAHTLVAGNPARRIGLVCTCGNRLDDTLVCACGRAFVRDAGGTLRAQRS
jgi:UDP-2-acetamido-3-amino-2,3-dideoxy-glucuronate N-acetyltransferase